MIVLVYQILAAAIGLNLSLGLMALMGLQWAGFLRRTVIAYINLSACAVFGAISAVLLTLVGKQRIAQWVTSQAFYYTMPLTTGVKFEVIGGAEHLNSNRPAVLVANHQSALDILMLATVWPFYCSVTAKKQLKNVPFLGWFMSFSGTVFLDRANRTSAIKAFEGAAEEMQKHKQSVFIFPEGTRSGTSEPQMLPFKKGAFHLAVQAKAPILPIVVCVYSGVFSTKEWRFRSGRIPIIVLPPIPTANLAASDVDELTKYTRDKMLNALTKLTLSKSGQQAQLASPPPISKEPAFISMPNQSRSDPQTVKDAEEATNAAAEASSTTIEPNNVTKR